MAINRKHITILALCLIGVVILTGLSCQVFQAQTTRPGPVPGPAPLTQRQRLEYCVVNEIGLTTLGWKAKLSHGGNVETVDSDMTGISVVNRLCGGGRGVGRGRHPPGDYAED